MPDAFEIGEPIESTNDPAPQFRRDLFKLQLRQGRQRQLIDDLWIQQVFSTAVEHRGRIRQDGFCLSFLLLLAISTAVLVDYPAAAGAWTVGTDLGS